jgi:bifunctional DNA-binding transcriptional regulator/antitoxin component of YhaV-PrlF toxin-antitoxin module
MRATLTLDEEGSIRLPEALKRAFGIQPGTPFRVEVTEGRIEIIKETETDVPEVKEVRDGVLVLPPGLSIPAGRIVSSIKADRDERIRHLSRR